jgi:hypothetical protein
MPPGRASWIRRSVGLAVARHLLRRSLTRQGAGREAVLATVIAGSAAAGGPVGPAPAWERRWAAKLSHPSVELLMQGDHVIVQEDGELIASGSLASSVHGRWAPHTER